jgi:hypothetical protein
MITRILIATAFSTLPFHANASEATQRDAKLSELQEVLGIDVTTSELNLDVPLYARFVLVTVDKGVTKEAILADLDSPANYFKFLNVTDARELIVPPPSLKAKCRRYIRMTTWIGDDHKLPQGRTFEFPTLDVGPNTSGSTNFLQPSHQVDVKSDIVVWDDAKVNTDNNIMASQKLVLRLSPEKPKPCEQDASVQPLPVPTPK